MLTHWTLLLVPRLPPSPSVQHPRGKDLLETPDPKMDELSLVTCASLADGHRQVVKGPEGFFGDSVCEAAGWCPRLRTPCLSLGLGGPNLRGAEEANAPHLFRAWMHGKRDEGRRTQQRLHRWLQGAPRRKAQRVEGEEKEETVSKREWATGRQRKGALSPGSNDKKQVEGSVLGTGWAGGVRCHNCLC